MKKIPGVLLCFAISLPAWFFGRAFPVIGGPVTAILAGIVISLIIPNILKPKFAGFLNFADGVKFSSKKLLQFSIVLLGFQMNLANILAVGRLTLIIMAFAFLAVFLTAFFGGKLLKLNGDTTTLIGVGTSICGASAIAAAAPVIRAGDEDVSRAISTIFLFNVIAIFIFPALGRLMGMNDVSFGIWAGTAINDTSSVVAAGAAWSYIAGNDEALKVATIVKLTRALMIVPVTLALAVYAAKRSQKQETGSFSFVKVFPWFVLFFIAAAIVNTFLGISENVTTPLVQIGRFLIITAMAAIGLGTNMKTLFLYGFKPITLGFFCWTVIVLISLIALNFVT